MFLHMSVILSTGGSLYDVTSGLAARGSVSGESLSRGVSVLRGVSLRDNPCVVKSGRYAFYWNAFLFLYIYLVKIKNQRKRQLITITYQWLSLFCKLYCPI